MADGISIESRFRTLVEETLVGGPCFLVEFAVRGTNRFPVVDIILDSDQGPSAHLLASISREVGFALDTAAARSYTLNVSSPGADRPLKLPRQYEKHVGRILRVCRLVGENSDELDGTLQAADAEGIVVEGTGHISYSDILWAKVKLPW